MKMMVKMMVENVVVILILSATEGDRTMRVHQGEY